MRGAGPWGIIGHTISSVVSAASLLAALIFAVAGYLSLRPSVPSSIRERFDDHHQLIVWLLGAAFIGLITSRALQRRCGSRPRQAPRPDLAATVGLVAESSEWCRRRESCEWAGHQCALVAAAELVRVAEMIDMVLDLYHEEWKMETRVGSPDATQSFLHMASEGLFGMTHARSELGHGVCTIVEELRGYSADIERMTSEFREKVVEVLSDEQRPHDRRQRDAAGAVIALAPRVELLREGLGEWQRGTKQGLNALRQDLRVSDA